MVVLLERFEGKAQDGSAENRVVGYTGRADSSKQIDVGSLPFSDGRGCT